MKAGIVEIPDIVAVTKSDMSEAARQARSDIKSAIKVTGAAPSGDEGWETKVLSVSAMTGEGIGELIAALDAHYAFLKAEGRLERGRKAQAQAWLTDAVRERFGREGLKRAGGLALTEGESPFRKLVEISRELGG
jgi:LAO/AO transport system kinase